jgi:magnesium transporter
MTQPLEQSLPRDEWGAIAPDFLQSMADALAASNLKQIRQATRDLHAADLSDLIEALDQPNRLRLISSLGRNFDVEALPELDEAVRDELLQALPNQVIASAITKLDTDDAVYLLEDMEPAEQADILAKLSKAERATLHRALEYPEDTAGRLMQTEFVAAPEFWNVQQALDYVNKAKDIPEHFVEIYVVDPGFHLKGTVPLARLLRAPRTQRLAATMNEEQVVFDVSAERDDIAYKFDQYNLVSAAVVDKEGRLVGSLMVDDIVEVIKEDAEEDILHLGGVGEEAIGDSVLQITRSRFSWLFVNLLTAVLASWVISWFEASLQQMVALAVLMPIVASMGGNAGTQTMTVAVRALATRHLGPSNVVKVTLRESAVGLINGSSFAMIVGGFSWWWFGSETLGAIIAAAIIINLVAAALAGILVPLALDHYDIDPAVASGTFVTTVTDVVGFFAFLGLATLWIYWPVL